MKRLVIDHEATAEFRSAIAHYEGRRPGLGGEFRAAVEATLRDLRANPNLGSLYKRTALRHFTMRRFPYVIYYADLAQAVWIAAIAHGRRRPGYFLKRRPPPTG